MAKINKAQAALNVVVSIGPKQTAYTGNPIAITGDITSSSASVTSVSSTVGLFAGQAISGTGIPTGATIATVGTGTLTLSIAATATTSTLAISVIPFVPLGAMKQAPTSGKKWTLEDVTTFDDGEYMAYLKTLIDLGKVALTGNRVSDDQGQILLEQAFYDTVAYMFQIAFPLSVDQVTSGDTVVFAALVEEFDNTVTIGKAITISSSLQVTAPKPTYTEGS